MSLVTTDWVLKNLDSLKIIDASWHMPAQKRNPAEEYLNAHIPNSVFFDLDENSEKIQTYHICFQNKTLGKK